MKADCLQSKFKDAVHQTEKIAGRNLSLPILECLLIETAKDSLVIKSTNLDIGIVVVCPAKIIEEGRAAVPASLLSSFLSALPEEGKITLELAGGNIFISNNRTSTVIKSYPAEDFPLIPSIEEEEEYKIESKKMVEGIKSVSYSASLSEMKPEISSVYIYGGSGVLIFAATDSVRLAEKRVASKNPPEQGSILPYKNANEIARVFEGHDGELSVKINKNQMTVSLDGVYLTTRLVNGVYPDYVQIIPKEKKTELVVLKKDISDAIKVSSVFSDKFNLIDIKIVPEDKLFEIKSKSSDKGENSTSVDSTIEGEAVELSINARFLLDGINTIEGDSVVFSFNGPGRPVVLSSPSARDFTYLVMPLNR